LEGERLQSPFAGFASHIITGAKRDGISFGRVIEQIVIFGYERQVVWTGYVFQEVSSEEAGLGVFLEGHANNSKEGRVWDGLELRSSLVALLDLAGDCLGCDQIIIDLGTDLAQTCKKLQLIHVLIAVSLLRCLMPLGFQLLHPDTHPKIPGTLIGMTI